MPGGRLRARYDRVRTQCPLNGTSPRSRIILPDATIAPRDTTPEEYMKLYERLPVQYVDPRTQQVENLTVGIRVYVNSTTPRGESPPRFNSRWHSNFSEMQALQQCIPNSCDDLDDSPIANPSFNHLLAMRHVLSGQAEIHEMQIYLAYALSYYDRERQRGTSAAQLQHYCNDVACRQRGSGVHTAARANGQPARLGLDCFGIIRAYLKSTGRVTSPIQSIPGARGRASQGGFLRTRFQDIEARDVIIWNNTPTMRAGHIAIISEPRGDNSALVVQSAESTGGLDAALYRLTQQSGEWTIQRLAEGGSTAAHTCVVASYACLQPSS